MPRGGGRAAVTAAAHSGLNNPILPYQRSHYSFTHRSPKRSLNVVSPLPFSCNKFFFAQDSGDFSGVEPIALGNVALPPSPQGRLVFWKRDNKVLVEILNPISINSPSISPQQIDAKATSIVKEIDKDLAFKLLTYFAIILQAGLLAYGYLELSAYYEQFGISTTELELGTPTILTYGYSYAFSSIMGLVYLIPFIGVLILGLLFISVALTFVYLLMNRVSKKGEILEKGTWGGMLLLLVFIAPVLGVHHGVERARENIKADSGIDTSNGISRVHSIITDKGEKITGQLVVADTKSSFLLVKDTLYKIDNKSNRVMRQTLLKAKDKKEPTDAR